MSVLSSQWQAGTQYYLYGKRHFTKTGFQSAEKRLRQALGEVTSMMGKNVLVADGEAIISEELMCIAASKGARIILVCNSNKKGALLQQRVCATAGTLRVDLIVADLTLVSEAQRVVTEMKALGCTQLDCIVSNMDGVDISPEPTFTSEGYETTFAKFLLAPFAMVTAAMPLLCAAAAPRVVLVSAGSMYTTSFPPAVLLEQGGLCIEGKHHPVAAHAFARRGQVLLAEAWARRLPQICFVSCIPGWVPSLSVDALNSNASKARMEPFRSAAEGAAGISWLMATSRDKLKSGCFYLDGSVQPTHLAGAFFTAGYATKNTTEEVDRLLLALETILAQPKLSKSDASLASAASAGDDTGQRATLDNATSPSSQQSMPSPPPVPPSSAHCLWHPI